MADGEWIAFFWDADDQWTPDKIEKHWATLAQYPELAIDCRRYAEMMIRMNRYPVGAGQTSVAARLSGAAWTAGSQGIGRVNQQNFITTGTVLVRRDVVLAAGLSRIDTFWRRPGIVGKNCGPPCITCLPGDLDVAPIAW